MSNFLSASRENPLHFFTCILLLALVAIGVIGILKVAAMNNRISDMDAALNTMVSYLSSLKTTASSAYSSLSSIEQSDVLAIAAVRLTTGDTWMIPCASANWTGN